MEAIQMVSCTASSHEHLAVREIQIQMQMQLQMVSCTANSHEHFAIREIEILIQIQAQTQT